MSTLPRDTQFAGFAHLLCEEIAKATLELSTEENNIVDGCIMCNWQPSKVATLLVPLIAQRAYDLVAHILSTIDPLAFQSTISDDQIIKDIPDLTEWHDKE